MLAVLHGHPRRRAARARLAARRGRARLAPPDPPRLRLLVPARRRDVPVSRPRRPRRAPRGRPAIHRGHLPRALRGRRPHQRARRRPQGVDRRCRSPCACARPPAPASRAAPSCAGTRPAAAQARLPDPPDRPRRGPPRRAPAGPARPHRFSSLGGAGAGLAAGVGAAALIPLGTRIVEVAPGVLVPDGYELWPHVRPQLVRELLGLEASRPRAVPRPRARARCACAPSTWSPSTPR
jgi:hypothetical protein